MATKTKITPRANKLNDNEVIGGDSAKKLVQARLPFKVISESPEASGNSAKSSLHLQKRKLSNDYELEADKLSESTSEKKEESATCSKKIRHDTEVLVVDLLEDEDENDGNVRSHKYEEQITSQCTPLRIKLPFLEKKYKRRKSLKSPEEANSSDDLENMSAFFNPQKRIKVDKDHKKSEIEETETIELEADEEVLTENVENANLEIDVNKNAVETNAHHNNETFKQVDSLKKNKNVTLIKHSKTETTTNKNKLDIKESEITTIANRSTKAGIDEDKLERQLKTLTPNQANYQERRRKEKEQRLLNEKLQKQLEKNQKEELKKQEREEKEDQRRKEREDKEIKRRQEREEKERKRQEEVDAKNEEKRKRIEVKEKELRKKNEERKRKDLAKEEAELKAKKAAEIFSKFFVACKIENTLVADRIEPVCANLQKNLTPAKLAFRPFQIKDAMKLAPLCRRQLSPDKYSHIDKMLNQSMQTHKVQNLYLTELRTGKHVPAKWQKSLYSPKDNNSYDDDDVLVIGEEVSRAGQVILEETHVSKINLRAKLYKFCENRRPPYYGTWRKRSKVITSRRPFAQDMKYLDYELDSDLEWEEEEPGELLGDSDGEDKDKESEENDDYDVDNEWMVPHGHLSDEELQDEDEDNSPAVQKVKLQIRQREFDIEMNKKTKKIRPRILGCLWLDINGTNSTDNSFIICQLLSKHSMLYTESPLLETPKTIEMTTSTQNSTVLEKPIKKQIFGENLSKDLVRLVHGNSLSKRFLAKEFRAYAEKHNLAENNVPSTSTVIRKIMNLTDWKLVNVDWEENNKYYANKEKNGIQTRHCWVVKEDILAKLGLENLSLVNKWQYVLSPHVSHNQHQSEKNKVNTNIIVENCVKEEPLRHEILKNEMVKKRVPILLSVARGKEIPISTKNTLISQFLNKKNDEQNVNFNHSSDLDVILID